MSVYAISLRIFPRSGSDIKLILQTNRDMLGMSTDSGYMKKKKAFMIRVET